MTSIRQVTDNVVTFGIPFARFNVLPIGGRSTAVKLRDGSVFLCASSMPDEATKKKLQEMGQVKYILAFDAVHHLSISAYKELYPAAKLIGVYPLIEKRKDLKWDSVFGRDAQPLGELETSGELQAEYFDSHANSDVAIFHADSKTLIQADLLFNLPATEQYSKSGKSPTPFWPLSLLSNSFNPYSSSHRTLLNGVSKDKSKFSASAKRVAAWDFQRIIPCHGDIIEGDGKKAWTTAYANFLK